MGYLLLSWKSPSLVTLGDIMASFLQNQDTILSKTEPENPAAIWFPKRTRWKESVSRRRFRVTNSFLAFAVLGSLTLLGACLYNDTKVIPLTFENIWSQGIGKVNAVSLVTFKMPTYLSAPPIAMIFLANMPQLVYSAVYMLFNFLITSMMVSYSWSKFGQRHISLRTSSPVGEQRSTYRLSMPYKLGIPMIALSALLHWLASQSVFLAQITDSNNEATIAISTVGYSAVGIFFLAVFFLVLLIGINILGRLKYPAGIPIVGINSQAMAKACRTRDAPSELMETRKIRWGERAEDLKSENRYLGFSSHPVVMPEEGVLYQS
jgi:hypothetical protein